MSSLKGETVLVIGGSSGLGLAVAATALEDGAEVTIAGRSEDRLREARAVIGDGVRTAAVDAVDEEQVAGLFDGFDTVDHVFVTVGVVGGGTLFEADTATHRPRLDARVWAAAHAARYGAPKMLRGGSITFCSGAAGVRPGKTTNPLAAASAGAVESMTRTLAVQLAPVRVNTVVPGIVETPLLTASAGDLEAIAERLPVGRVGRAEDIAQAVRFFMTNGYVTGQTLIVDGGGVLV
ncbi:SDR family oxidoreductase [Streptomyces lincolnensis]|uniref:SDR family oxidoreductase n=1 Tax=Streptomyces TaxID=1883 RepID=UPI001E393110|nr:MULTISPECIES: SDR family oxidoreductase [Streptomyces]MCD7436621.1 SDR family oxidoreductase [Streptomyces lincolnensis]WLW50830.1 SDR family oxidoreductase [Streptomyces coralus]